MEAYVFREKRLLDVGTTVMVRPDLETCLEGKRRSISKDSEIAGWGVLAVNESMYGVRGRVAKVKWCDYEREKYGIVTVRLSIDGVSSGIGSFRFSYDMLNPVFENKKFYKTLSGIELMYDLNQDALVFENKKIKPSDYNVFFEHKNIKSLSIIKE